MIRSVGSHEARCELERWIYIAIVIVYLYVLCNGVAIVRFFNDIICVGPPEGRVWI